MLPQGPEITVNGPDPNPLTLEHQAAPAVCVLADGRILMVWMHPNIDQPNATGRDIHGRFFGADGQPLGAEFRINSYVLANEDVPSVTALPDGGALVTWHSDANASVQPGDGDTDAQIRGRIIGSGGPVGGSDFLVNTTTEGSQRFSSATTLDDGRVAVVWEDISGAELEIRGRVFDPAEPERRARRLRGQHHERRHPGQAAGGGARRRAPRRHLERQQRGSVRPADQGPRRRRRQSGDRRATSSSTRPGRAPSSTRRSPRWPTAASSWSGPTAARPARARPRSAAASSTRTAAELAPTLRSTRPPPSTSGLRSSPPCRTGGSSSPGRMGPTAARPSTSAGGYSMPTGRPTTPATSGSTARCLWRSSIRRSRRFPTAAWWSPGSTTASSRAPPAPRSARKSSSRRTATRASSRMAAATRRRCRIPRTKPSSPSSARATPTCRRSR